MDPLDITKILLAAEGGDRSGLDDLLPAVYDELRTLAHAKLERERQGHTLQTTALAHEAYLKLVDQHAVKWQGRAHFLALAAQAMRRILVDHARSHARVKRGQGAEVVSISGVLQPDVGEDAVDVLALDESLARLAELEPVAARVVELRFFGDLAEDEIAAVLDISDRTVRRHWHYAKAWLYRALNEGGGAPAKGG
ncbi:MAG: sigma-70 family RNA polymerase sigma factor [Planctomycetota bacterium]